MAAPARAFRHQSTRMTTTIVAIVIVMALALFFLWPIPYLAIVVIAMHPIFWALLVLAFGVIVAALTYLGMQPDPFDNGNPDRTRR
jgi:hypothetical protein